MPGSGGDDSPSGNRSSSRSRFGAIQQGLKRAFDIRWFDAPRHDRDAAGNFKPVFNHTASHESERNIAGEQPFRAKLNPWWVLSVEMAVDSPASLATHQHPILPAGPFV